MTIDEYISKINTRYISGISTEHSYRGDLQNLLDTLVTHVLVIVALAEMARIMEEIETNKYEPGYLPQRTCIMTTIRDITKL
jgi:hypothetical protein